MPSRFFRPYSIDRRRFLTAAGAGALALGVGCASRSASSASAAPAAPPDTKRSRAIADLERAHGGRLGVASLDLATGRRVEHRADERFPFCSTCKTLAVASTLHRVDRGEDKLDRALAFTAADTVAVSPTCKANLDAHDGHGSMTLAELCEATIQVSDCTAFNLLVREAGGLSALTGYLRALGDPTTHMDRLELELNSAIPGDVRDTTSPRATVDNLQRFMIGDALSAAMRTQLVTWHLGTKTGVNRLRAGLPAGWQLAHKTGTSDNGVINDIGVVFPPDRAPIVIAVFYTETTAPTAASEPVLAEVARICAA
jgi:beta-lactamase class A